MAIYSAISIIPTGVKTIVTTQEEGFVYVDDTITKVIFHPQNISSFAYLDEVVAKRVCHVTLIDSLALTCSIQTKYIVNTLLSFLLDLPNEAIIKTKVSVLDLHKQTIIFTQDSFQELDIVEFPDDQVIISEVL